MLLALWSPKGGSGTSVMAAACSIVLAHALDAARLADLAGDQPAILGLAADPGLGLADWLAAGAGAPTEAIDRLAVDVGRGLELLPRGATDRTLAPPAAAEAGAALAVALRDLPMPVVADAGRAATPAERALVEVADHSVVVVRECYLALRRAVHASVLGRATGAVVVREEHRSLSPKDVTDVTELPVLAVVDVRKEVSRAVDAGVLPTRLPEGLARPATQLLGALDLLPRRRGRVA